MIKITLLLCLGFGFASANECINKPDDTIVNAGCQYYEICRNGSPIANYCIRPRVFNHAKGQCDDPVNTPPPCGNEKSCGNTPDGRYPILEMNCRCYYTCQDGQNMGTQCCPDGLTWDVYDSLCNWPRDVPPPCGTYSPEPITTAKP
ncbi:DgyrCDS4596 [Dimorphilus gyrociliatus]|uniref:DgyrCDS4596 n=1 Tax=Dimorphilus gyrociliatus TaxID=2664684 RepID=A0A7I8VHI1_9ANNE|nr:DgyrCDS4596 [Dimorphilus gyrociliatus]